MARELVKGAVVGAITSSILLVSTAAVAGTGVGGVFNLGKTNKVNAQSTLTGSTSGKNLQINNSGAGPALGLAVGAGKAPLVVNATAGKATNLNADKLDGLNSTDFYKKTDTVANATHAGSADSADTATNATNLGGSPASAYQKQCQNGAVMGRAEVNGAGASTVNWTTAGVNPNTAWVCNSSYYGSNVLVKQVSTGRFDVVFGDTVNGNAMGLGTGNGPLAQATSETVGNTVAANGPWQCAPGMPPPVYVTCFEVYMRDSTGTLTNTGSFTVTIG